MSILCWKKIICKIQETYPDPSDEKSRLDWNVYAVSPRKTVTVRINAWNTITTSQKVMITPTKYA